MDNTINPNSKFSYEELLEQNTQLRKQIKEIEEKSKKVEDKNLYKEKYRHTIEKLNNSGSWELDLINNIQTWSENYCFLLGYDEKIDNPDEQLFLSHVYPEDLDRVKTAMQKSMEEQRPTELEFRYVPKDGTIKYAHSKAEYIFDEKNNITKIIGSFQDITERRQNEDKLINNQYYLSKAQEIGKIGTWELDIIHNKLVWTKENCINFGLKHGTPLTYDVFLNCIHPDDRDYVNSEWKSAIKGKPYDIEHRIISDGKVKWLREKAEVEFDDNGKAVSAIGFTQDITKFKEAEQNLKESEKLYKILFENIIDEVHYWKVIKDKNGEIKTWELVDTNPSALKAWNKSKEQVIGKTPNEIFNTDAQKLFMPIVKKIFKTGKSFSWETYFPPTKQYLSMDSIPLGDFFISTGRDITIRKKEEQVLIKAKEIAEFNERELNKVQEITRIGSWYLDVVTNEVLWTEELYKMYGFDPTQPVPPYTEHMKLFTTESWELLSESLEQTRKSGIPYELELRTIKEDGSNGWMWVRGEAIQKNGVTVKLWGAAQDITERKHAEEALRSSQEMLVNSQSLASICSYSTNLVLTDIDKSQWVCSPEFYKIFGIDETYPHTIEGWIGFLHPEYREDVVAYHESVVLEKKSFNREYKIIRINDGVERWVHGTGELVYDEKGNPIRMHGAIQDITERKQAELALKESEEILKTTLQTAMDGYWVVDMNGRFINVNDTYCKMSGYKREDFLSMFISDVEAIQSPKEINENIQKIKRLGQLRFETKHVRKDGSIYDTEIGIQYQERNNGQFVCFIKDITEQKKHEAAIVLAKEVAEQNELKIKLNEQRLKALVELNQMTDKSDDYIYDFTLNKAIELTQSKIGFLGFVNNDESQVDIYKWSDSAMKECAVRNINMNFIVDETGVWGDVIRQRKPLVLNDYSQPNPNKKGIPVGHININNYLSIPTFQQNKIVAIISVSNKEDDYVQSDINQLTLLLDGMRRFLDQRKEKEALINARQKAEESQMQLELITDNFVNGMIYQVAMLDENRRQFNYISNNVKKLYGCTVKEAKEDANLIYGKLHPDDVMGLIEKEKEALKNMSVFETESRVITPNGNIRWAYYISKPRIINGIVCWDGIEVDITERKQMELELINAKEKAEESDRLKSAFLANMSHEIRTPMNGILGFTTLLQDANLSVENQKHYIDIIEKSGNRLLNTVNDIIEISKIESGDINVAKSEVDIIGHLDTLVTFFRPEAEKKNIEIVMQNNIDGNDLTITTDKNKLSSILSNLIKNAIKYTNEGTIKVGLKVKNNQVLFSCKDTGIGIPKNRQEAIFNRFEQADIDDKQAHQGSGLGLAIVKTYVEMLDGKIWVESEVSQGSTFYVSLPYKHEKKREQIIPKEASSSDSGIKNIKVLVVEDEEYSSMHLSILIKDKVKSIKTVENGIEAIDACKNDSGIDLILMDIKMPKMNGIEATKKIRKFNKDVVIIAQTAYALEGDEGRALDAGCDDYISKPIDENILFELINKYF
jgi:PAS domain S-box-containing protein